MNQSTRRYPEIFIISLFKSSSQEADVVDMSVKDRSDRAWTTIHPLNHKFIKALASVSLARRAHVQHLDTGDRARRSCDRPQTAGEPASCLGKSGQAHVPASDLAYQSSPVLPIFSRKGESC